MTSPSLLAAALTASLFAAGFAAAQGAPMGAPQPKPRVACAADVQKFCPTAAPGKEAMRCMKSHMGEASPGCQSSVQAARAMHAQRKSAMSAAPPADSAPPPPQ